MSSTTRLCILAVTAACACGGGSAVRGDAPPKEDPVAHAKAFLQWYFDSTATLEKTAASAYWTASLSGAKEDFDAFAAADLALRTFHSDPARYAEVEGLLKDGAAIDPLDRRALEVADLAYKGNQLPADLLRQMVEQSAAIEQIFNTYRATLDGAAYTNNDLLERLAKETDSAKRQAIWRALKQVGEQVGPRLIALARVRNQAARTLGYKDFWDMQVRLQEHDPDALIALFDRLRNETDAPYRAMKADLDAELARRFGIAPGDMMPWHYDNPFFQAAPPSEKVDPDVFYQGWTKEDVVRRGVAFYEDIGLPLGDIVDHSDYYEREGKDQHAFCITIDRGADVRTLLNVKPTAEWMDTMLHESGHAVYYRYVDRTLPYDLRESAHILTTEGIAMLFGALARNPAWLVSYAGADPGAVAAVRAPLLEQRRREQLIFARWALVMFSFERALYANPDQDLNTLWWDTVERLQGLKRPAGRDAPDWAAKPHFTIAPVYYHNYLLGELFGAQVRARLAALAGYTGPASGLDFTGHKDFGTYLKDKVFAPGMRMKWPAFVREATGRDLGPEAFVSEVAAPAK